MQTAQISREFSRLTEGYKIQHGSKQKICITIIKHQAAAIKLLNKKAL